MKLIRNYLSYVFFALILAAFLSLGGFLILSKNTPKVVADELRLDEQEMTIRAINKAIPGVVSIIVSESANVRHIDDVSGVTTETIEKDEKGSGTGFLISSDGLIVTNKHVIEASLNKNADYRVILNSGKKYYAQLIGKDPLNDLAVLKIFDTKLPYLELAKTSKLPLGTSVIAIGNVLGKYQNSVTKGIVSGLGRSIVASDLSGRPESLDNVIQTDAEINLGNSGGPLINLQGQVVGINVAIDREGSSIGFAIPIDDVKQVISSVKTNGRIIRARLGVRHLMLTPEIALEKKLNIESGALILSSETGNDAIMENSPSSLAGLMNGDIIMEIDGVKLDQNNSLLSTIQKYKPGKKIGLRIMRDNKIIVKIVTLDEFISQ